MMLTAEKVNDEFMKIQDQGFDDVILGVFLILSLVLALVIIGIIIYQIVVDYAEFYEVFNTILIGFLVWVIGLLVCVILTVIEVDSPKVKDWTKNYAEKYIKGLPDERHEIVYLKITTEEQSDKGSEDSHNVKTTDTKYVVTYKDGKELKTKVIKAKANMSLGSTEKPYIKYKHLKENLGEGNDMYEKGYYNVKIYLPEDYKFDTIK